MSSDRQSAARPRKHRFLGTVLIVAVVLVGADQVYRLILQGQVHAELDAFRKQGYPVTAAELGKSQSSLSALPDSENGALKILEAADDLALSPDAFSPGRWPMRAEEMAPAERDTLAEILTNNAPALEALHAAARLKESRFPLDYSLGPALRLPHLAKIKSLAQLLKAEAHLSSEEGKPELAVKSIVDGVCLARSLDHEPILISQWVRLACLEIDCSSLERLLNQHALSLAQLTALSEAFDGAAQSSQAAFAHGFLGEICLGVFCFTAPPAEVMALLNPEGASPVLLGQAAFPLYAWTGLRDRDFLFYLRTLREMIDAAKAPYPESRVTAKHAGQHAQQNIRTLHLKIISGLLLPALQRAVDRATELQARLRCAQAALALECYRQTNNRVLPASLAQLAPAIMTSVPADPIDGAPLRYRKRTAAPGYLIYSVGTDGLDNGGVPGDFEAWTWPPGSKPSAANAQPAANKFYDVVFTVER